MLIGKFNKTLVREQILMFFKRYLTLAEDNGPHR